MSRGPQHHVCGWCVHGLYLEDASTFCWKNSCKSLAFRRPSPGVVLSALCWMTGAPPRALGVARLRPLLFLQFGDNLCHIWVLASLLSDHRRGLSGSLINFSPEDVCPCSPHCCGLMTRARQAGRDPRSLPAVTPPYLRLLEKPLAQLKQNQNIHQARGAVL